MRRAEVEIVSFEHRYVLLTNGVTLPITDFFDDDGDECEPDDASVFVAGTDEFGWITVDIPDDDFEVVLQ